MPWSLRCRFLGAILAPAILPLMGDNTAHATDELELSTLGSMTLEELLDVPVAVASHTGSSYREAPAIITVISGESIRRSGARDLMDVLAEVPGFWFGVDVFNVVGLGFRGNWGHEGKILLLIDGHVVNEGLFGTTQFGNHFPLFNVDRIEIMRGPGSVVYGDFSELAVINVISKAAPEDAQLRLGMDYGQTQRALGRRRVHFAYGQTVRALDDLALRVSGSYGQGNRSSRRYRDVFGTEYNMSDVNRMDPLTVNAEARYRKLRVQLIHDHYRTTMRDGAIKVTEERSRDFTSSYLHLSYPMDLGKIGELTHLLSYRSHRPWNHDDAGPSYFDTTAKHLLARVSLLTKAWNDRLSWVIGAEGAIDEFLLRDGSKPTNALDTHIPSDETSPTVFRNLSLFLETRIDTFLGNLQLGCRYNDHSRFDSSFVPRIAYTTVLDPLHFKVMLSRAMKTPLVYNLIANGQIITETTTDLEVETGLRISKHGLLTVNVFDVTINDPIIYFVDPIIPTDGYHNRERTGTRGLESELRVDWKPIDVGLAYGFYTASGKERVSGYSVASEKGMLLAFPQHKITARASIALLDWISLTVNTVFVTKRYGYDRMSPTGYPVIRKFGPAVLVNAHVSFWAVKGFDLGMGIHNALNTRVKLIQPYDGAHAPLPAFDREVFIQITHTNTFEDATSE